MTHSLFIVFLLLAGMTATAHAGDAAAGKAKSVMCAACHGIAGISNNDEWPNLAGQKETYLRKQITEFRDGRRINALMAPMVKRLSDDDIANLAAFYTSLKAEVQ